MMISEGDVGDLVVLETKKDKAEKSKRPLDRSTSSPQDALADLSDRVGKGELGNAVRFVVCLDCVDKNMKGQRHIISVGFDDKAGVTEAGNDIIEFANHSEGLNANT